MKKKTVTLSLKERNTVGALAKQLKTTRSCVMHKALHAYAKALRYQKTREKKSHLRSTDKPFTNEENFYLKSHLRTKRRK